jgi:aspartyl-tRNA(Asn)/glutamyl-tRNA(Gln) amidotransferase subunit B
MVARIADGTLSNSGARQVFDALWREPGRDLDTLIDVLGVRQGGDSEELSRTIDEVLANNPKSVAEFRAGKDKAFNALVGQVMKASKGKANPAQVSDLLRSKLG